MKADFIRCFMFSQKRKNHIVKKIDFVNKILLFESEVKKIKWSLNDYRKLMMLFLWQNFSNIDDIVDLKITQFKKTMKDNMFFCEWFSNLNWSEIQNADDKISMQNRVNMLKRLLKKTFKTKAFLKNIRFQINHFIKVFISHCRSKFSTIQADSNHDNLIADNEINDSRQRKKYNLLSNFECDHLHLNSIIFIKSLNNANRFFHERWKQKWNHSKIQWAFIWNHDFNHDLT